MKLTRTCIALLPLFLVDTAEAAQCIEQKTNRVRFGEKSRQHYFILAKSGEPCVTAFRRSGGRGDNRAYLYTDLRVLQRAENGVGGVHGPSSFGYQSTPGFTGKDTFLLQLTGERPQGGGRRTVTIQVNVAVTP